MPDPPAALSWAEAVELLALQPGVVMLVGATDVGKSTLALAAANAAVRAGRRAAILDTDLGQSEVGPPGTIGVVRLEAPVAALAELKPRAMAFVGASSPTGHLLNIVQGTRHLVCHALNREDDVVLVDTSGMVEGRMAEKLKLAKLAVLAPGLVVCVEKAGELDRLAALLAGSTGSRVVRVQAAPEARKKSTVYRKMRRAARMRRHFEAARVHDLDAGQVRVLDAWLYTGTPLPARQLRLASDALAAPVPHGEITPDGVYLCATRKPDRRGLVVLQEEFGRKRVVVTPASLFQNLLVGLVGPAGHVLDVGLLQGVNFERALFSVLTPARSVAEVGQLHFGRLRTRPDGAEIAHLRPGDL
ncbi:MAG TPA: Clp1/GlmU family protein [Armatimonadota bacterium]|nr:Clp1/GlmU family protein [Armatimonadota bacterium]